MRGGGSFAAQGDKPVYRLGEITPEGAMSRRSTELGSKTSRGPKKHEARRGGGEGCDGKRQGTGRWGQWGVGGGGAVRGVGGRMGVCRVTGLKIVLECKGPSDTEPLEGVTAG